MEKLTEQLNEFGTWLFHNLAALSLELAVLAVLVVLAMRILQIQSSAIRHLFWVLVLIKPIVGFTVSSPFSVYTLVFPSDESVGGVVASSSVSTPAANPPALPPSQKVELNAFGFLAMAWLAVALFLSGRLLVGFGALLYLRRTASVQHQGPLRDALDTAFNRTGNQRGVDVATSDAVQFPLLTGVLRPLILFPSQLADKLQPEQLVMILVHEISHLRRFDNFTLLLQRLVQAALFFHPVVWLCGRMLRREAEQACDDTVIRVTGQSAQYADGLARVAEMASIPTERNLPMNAFAAAETHLSVRIKRLLGDRLGSISMSSRVVGLVTIGVLGFFCLPTVSEEQGAGEGTSIVDAETWKKYMQQLIDDPEFVRIAVMAPAERTEEDNEYYRMKTQPLTEVRETTSHLLIPDIEHKITFNPAETNSERFAVLGLSLAFSDIDDEARAPFSPQEVETFTEFIDRYTPQVRGIVLRIMRAKTIDDLESDRIHLAFEEILRELDRNLAAEYRDALDGRPVKLEKVIATNIIVQ